ncbi:MAG: glutaredoxin family protein [Candidatus Nezhaarchaeales archaeon]
MSLEDAFKQFNTVLQQTMQLMMFVLLIAIVVSILGVKRKIGKVGAIRPKTAGGAMKEIMGHEGWVLVTVDPDKCGYCEAARIMLGTRGIPYLEVNISDLPEEELEEFIEQTGIEWVPVLLLVRDGRIIMRKHFEGKKEKDIPWVRRLEVEA